MTGKTSKIMAAMGAAAIAVGLAGCSGAPQTYPQHLTRDQANSAIAAIEKTPTNAHMTQATKERIIATLKKRAGEQ